MGLFPLILLVVLLGSNTFVVAQEIVVPEEQEATDNGRHDEDGEAKGAPEVITPITLFPEKKPYLQAQEELVRAQDLWKKGKAEEASDLALEAYDDFADAWVPKKERPKRRLQRRQAATLYIEAGIACIQAYVQKSSATPEAVAEGRARLGDLRDVARNYPELSKKLTTAVNTLGSDPDIPR